MKMFSTTFSDYEILE